MRKYILIGVAVVIGSAFGVGPAFGQAVGPRGGVGAKWEYKVLSRGQIEELGQQRFEAGLNRLGEEGWELVAVDPELIPPPPIMRNKPAEYVFKRLRGQAAARMADVQERVRELQGRIKLARADLEVQRERLTWAERAASRDYISNAQVTSERSKHDAMAAILETLRKELESISPTGRDRRP